MYNMFCDQKKQSTQEGRSEWGVQGRLNNFWNNPNTQQKGNEL